MKKKICEMLPETDHIYKFHCLSVLHTTIRHLTNSEKMVWYNFSVNNKAFSVPTLHNCCVKRFFCEKDTEL